MMSMDAGITNCSSISFVHFSFPARSDDADDDDGDDGNESRGLQIEELQTNLGLSSL